MAEGLRATHMALHYHTQKHTRTHTRTLSLSGQTHEHVQVGIKTAGELWAQEAGEVEAAAKVSESRA